VCFYFGKGKPIVDPKDFVMRENIRLPTSKCILAFSVRTVRVVREYMENTRMVPIKIPLYEPTVGKYENEDIFVSALNIGAPASVLSLELLIAAGAEEVIVIGSGGSIHPDANIGDILIPTWGLREEGTSYHYVGPEYIPKPNVSLLNRLRNEIGKIVSEDVHVVEGGVWSIDAIFRETTDKIREYRNRGVIGVDMESTALMTVSHYRNIALAIALVITDELYSDSWKYEWESDRIIRSEKIIALASLRTLAKG